MWSTLINILNSQHMHIRKRFLHHKQVATKLCVIKPHMLILMMGIRFFRLHSWARVAIFCWSKNHILNFTFAFFSSFMIIVDQIMNCNICVSNFWVKTVNESRKFPFLYKKYCVYLKLYYIHTYMYTVSIDDHTHVYGKTKVDKNDILKNLLVRWNCKRFWNASAHKPRNVVFCCSLASSFYSFCFFDKTENEIAFFYICDWQLAGPEWMKNNKKRIVFFPDWDIIW